MWQGWITGVLGVWLIVASFVFSGNVFNELGVGVMVAVIGFWAAVTSFKIQSSGEGEGR